MSTLQKPGIPTTQKIEKLCHVYRAAQIAKDLDLRDITAIELRMFGVIVDYLRAPSDTEVRNGK